MWFRRKKIENPASVPVDMNKLRECFDRVRNMYNPNCQSTGIRKENGLVYAECSECEHCFNFPDTETVQYVNTGFHLLSQGLSHREVSKNYFHPAMRRIISQLRDAENTGNENKTKTYNALLYLGTHLDSVLELLK